MDHGNGRALSRVGRLPVAGGLVAALAVGGLLVAERDSGAATVVRGSRVTSAGSTGGAVVISPGAPTFTLPGSAGLPGATGLGGGSVFAGGAGSTGTGGFTFAGDSFVGGGGNTAASTTAADIRERFANLFQPATPVVPPTANAGSALGAALQIGAAAQAQATLASQESLIADRVCPQLLTARAQVVTQIDTLIARFPFLADRLGTVRQNVLLQIDTILNRFGCQGISPG